MADFIQGSDDSSPNTLFNMGGTWWCAMIVTAIRDCQVSEVRLKLSRRGTPGNFTVSLRNVDANHRPNGADIVSGTINGDALALTSVTPPAVFTAIPFSSPVVLTGGREYAIVMRAPNGSTPLTIVNAWFHYGAGTGTTYYTSSTDSGSTWPTVTANTSIFSYQFWGTTSGQKTYVVKVRRGIGSDVYTNYTIATNKAMSVGDQCVLLFNESDPNNPLFAGKISSTTKISAFGIGSDIKCVEGLNFAKDDKALILNINNDPNSPIAIQNVDTSKQYTVIDLFGRNRQAYPPKGGITTGEMAVAVPANNDVNQGTLVRCYGAPFESANLVLNPSFEQDFEFWSSGGSIAISSMAHSGVKSAYARPTNGYVSTNIAPFPLSQLVQCGFWIYPSSSFYHFNLYGINIRIYGSKFEGGWAYLDLMTAWRQVLVNYPNILFYGIGCYWESGSYYMDDFIITKMMY